jgi:hypothetical protein
MKTLRLFSIFFSQGLISMAAMSFTSTDSADLNNAGAYAPLPDLKVSQIATSGGLCKGNLNKVRVNVTNSQMISVKEKIAVILYVSQQGSQPSSYVGYLEKGIGPNDNSGQPVWFNNVVIPDINKKVTLKAVVNPDQKVQESNYNNNAKIINARVTKICDQAAPVAAGASLEMTVYKEGSWRGGNYQGISGALVTVNRSGQNYTGTTGYNGKYTFPSIPKGSVRIKVEKQGYLTVTQSYMMPFYPAKKNIGMRHVWR